MTSTHLTLATALALIASPAMHAQAPLSATQVSAISDAVVQHHTTTATRRDSLYIVRGMHLPTAWPEVRVVSSVGCRNDAQPPECSPLLTPAHRSQIAREIAERLRGRVIAWPEIVPNVPPARGESPPNCSVGWERGHERLIIEWVSSNGSELLVRVVSMQQHADLRCFAGGGAFTLVIAKTGDTYRLSAVRDKVYYE